MNSFDSAAVKKYLLDLQELIVTRLEQVDGKLFRRDSWDRPQGGGGISCILEEGKVLEEGSHDELLKNDGSLYKKLWSLQAGGFLQE